MSRESDSSSSGARGGSGGAAYPSGTPPYGSRLSPSPEALQGGVGDGEADAAAKPEDPKTETTLTTRIRINIPGSRPIPPVVMRKAVSEDGVPGPRSGEDDGDGAEHPGAPSRPDAVRSPELGAAAAEGRADGAKDREGREKGGKGGDKTSDWFAPARRSKGSSTTQSTPMPPAPETTQQFPAPNLGGGTQADLPYFSDPGAGLPGEPSGPTTGPVTGDMRMPGAPARDEDLLAPPGPGAPTGPGLPDSSGVGPLNGAAGQPPTPPGGSPLGSLGATTGATPMVQPGPGGRLGGPGMDADSAPSLFRDPEFTAPSGPDQASSDTLVSGVPVVPQADGISGPPAGKGQAPPTGNTGDSAPPSSPAPKAAAAGKPKKKGRSKVVMLGALVVVAAGVAYAAGLVMNHADVPNGTTVLGVDIGGSSKQVAVDKLDTALGGRTGAPLKVTVDGDQKQIKPSVAGLALDTEATVRNVAGRDYNPVTVIGSLFGGTHEAEPAVTVDEEKLRDALGRLAGNSGTAREGTITFKPGKATPVYGREGRGLDIDKAVTAVSDAYRERAETGKDKAVDLPVVAKRPTISKAEVDAKMKSFAEPAMSGLVTIKTDDTHSIQFGPDRSLPQILSMRPIGGKLQPHFDLAAIKRLYGQTFDGVLIERADGSKKPVTPQEVAISMRTALLGKTTADRTAVIDTSPN
ncbi:peptidoglycan binding domain-containing protein [Streptomyces sp. NPDC021098]|uniref:peptidoglycan binding domain-containing protein n=1 Tax=unclassified Streptomyces TaxID=2593676 RepID=UPI0037ACF578